MHPTKVSKPCILLQKFKPDSLDIAWISHTSYLIISLKDLPVELRLMIFPYLPDITTLSALVHASPAYHAAYAAYAANREKIFTYLPSKSSKTVTPISSRQHPLLRSILLTTRLEGRI